MSGSNSSSSRWRLRRKEQDREILVVFEQMPTGNEFVFG